ncbi:Mur ligase family protein [Methanobrevibacter filiformis]|uniref:UDP-N-acetylmuramoylalanine--D-glutamate ligase n=1 Tax=Methanobrevibacter filiformis TaxID=55758 RepID=A0A166AE02_9EURY|nr:Mur ligase family protein [Methanobrevibacter filiformis]KZX11913.1 UDP-N-acetylmuramoylalanine--D-glutamate ligase [Methanobrevibacter filiformis]
MIKGKNILVVGAGNAGRPVANILNYLGNNVVVNDSNIFENLPKKAQRNIKILKKRDVKFELGNHDPDSLKNFDYAFISPNIPKNLEFIKKIHELEENNKITIIETKDIGKILNSLINIPMIGISGTDGKTTTTNMINFIFNEKLNTLIFSSLQNSLVIEGLVEMIINEKSNSNDDDKDNNDKSENKRNTKDNKGKNNEINEDNDNKELAIFELPHGTIRLVEGLELSAGVLTNLTPDHMDEFNSFEDYIQRNIAIDDLINSNGLIIVNGDDPIINSRLDSLSSKYIVYSLENPQKVIYDNETYYCPDINYDVTAKDIKLNGLSGSEFIYSIGKIPTLLCANCNLINCNCNNHEVKYIGPLERKIAIQIPGMCNVENTLSTLTMSLIFGQDIDCSINRIETFTGVKGRFEKIDNVNGVNIFMDAAHNPESIEKLFKGLDVSGRLIVSLDNPDTLTSRNKLKIGEILSRYVDVVISSSKNETTEAIDSCASYEVKEGARELEFYITDNVVSSILKALEISSNGDTIIHIGPGVVNAYDNVRNDIITAISFYKSLSGKVVVIGGCGTVGSLIARILKGHCADVVISDNNDSTYLNDVFINECIELSLGDNDEKLLKSASAFFLAPSLEKNSKVVNYLKSVNDVAIYGIYEILNYINPHKEIYAVTGTNGKTTTVNMLKTIFKSSGLTVPEHMLNIQGNTEYIPSLQSRLSGDVGVIEIGTFGNKNEIAKSARLSKTNTGIITNISKDHLNNKNFNDYINCKKEIVEIADNLILNGNDPIATSFNNLSKTPENTIFFGINDNNNNNNSNNNNLSSNNLDKYGINDLTEPWICPDCGESLEYNNKYLGHLGNYICECGFKSPKLDVEALDISISPTNGELNQLVYTLKIGEKQGKITVNGGIANVYNSLAAAAGAFSYNIPFDEIIRGLNSFTGVPGRFEVLNTTPVFILDFAHNPAGVSSIIQSILFLKNNSVNNNSSSKLIVLNTISSESGEEGDLKIANILSKADIIIPVSNSAFKASKGISTKLHQIKTSVVDNKEGTLGATYNQVKEGIELSLDLANNNDFILIIGEAGTKYSKDILSELLKKETN